MMESIRARIQWFDKLDTNKQMKIDTWKTLPGITKESDDFTFLDKNWNPTQNAPIDFMPANKQIAMQNWKIFELINNKLIDLKDYKEEELAAQDSPQAVSKLFVEIEELIKQDKLHDAEEKYIEIIGRDSQNLKAFSGLGDLYFEQKNLDEARQTYLHALKLSEQNFDQAAKAQKRQDAGLAPTTEIQDNTTELAGIYFDLACVNRAAENLKEATENINKALKLEPNNPRYLDTWLEISIINKDKGSALDAYGRLKKVNPENQKLAQIKKEINEL